MTQTNEKVEEKTIVCSSSGNKNYFPVQYKYDDVAKCHVPYFDKPIDMFQKIQASKSSVDITTIVQRATLGDMTVLHLGEKPYGDIADIPDNLNDLNKMNLEAINNFAKLDPSIKKLFNNDLNSFVKAVEDGSYIDVITKGLTGQNEPKNDVIEEDKESVK